ncbi:MAG: restriction endonuclease [Chloroflexi bacterium]|nr:restriction endonuclease [Chloroflexota bacterium]
MPQLTIKSLIHQAKRFSELESKHLERSLFGVTDGKAVGTYLEHKFRSFLKAQYNFREGNTANGVDFPGLSVDMKVTSIRQPQSSCPFRSAREKIYGLDYALLVFVYDKHDYTKQRASQLNIAQAIFVNAERTGDYQTTRGILQLLHNDGNRDDLIAFFDERHLPIDDIQAEVLAAEILQNPPVQGFLTISNALQWRLQYGRALEMAGREDGVVSIYRAPA